MEEEAGSDEGGMRERLAEQCLEKAARMSMNSTWLSISPTCKHAQRSQGDCR